VPTPRAALVVLNAALALGVGPLVWRVARPAPFPADERPAPDFSPLDYAPDPGAAGPRDHAASWRALDRPRPAAAEVARAPEPARPEPPSACEVLTVLVDADPARSSAIVATSGRQRSVGVGEPLLGGVVAAIGIEEDAEAVYGVVWLERDSGRTAYRLRRERPAE